MKLSVAKSTTNTKKSTKPQMDRRKKERGNKKRPEKKNNANRIVDITDSKTHFTVLNTVKLPRKNLSWIIYL